MKQIQWEESKKKLLQKLIVKAKITNQIETLRMNNKSKEVIERLFDFSKEVSLGDVGNREGLAAKMYFREIFGNEFIRFDNDVCNAALNYGYSIFRSTISSIIIAKGYIGNIGLFHKGKSNMFNLSDDIIEVFRPIVDNYVLNYISDEILFKQEHREELIKLVNAKIKFNGKVHTITNVIGYYFDSIIKTLDSENENDFIYPEVKVYYDL